MSSGLECTFIEEAEGVVWYVLQDYDCPVGAWDWMEYASAYGPFTTQTLAEAHLDRNHANPGGWNETSYKHGWKPDANFERLKVEAAERAKLARSRPTYRW